MNCLLELRSDCRGKDLMIAQVRAAVNDAVAYGCGIGIEVIPHSLREFCKSFPLRLQEVFLLQQCGAGCGAKMKAAFASANTFRTAGSDEFHIF